MDRSDLTLLHGAGGQHDDRQTADNYQAALSRLGISGSAEVVWRQLMRTPNASMAQVRRAAGIPAAECKSAIEALINSQLLRESSSPTGVTVVDPTLALEAHIARAERVMAEQIADIAALRSQVPTYADEYSRGRITAGEQPGFEIIVDMSDIQRQLDLVAGQAKDDCRSLEHGPPTMEAFDEPPALQVDVLKRGVRDRMIVAPHLLDIPANYDYLAGLQVFGHETRTLPDISTRLVILDRSLAVLPVDPTNMPLGAIFVRVPSLIDLLILMYERLWSVAMPVFTTPDDDDAPSGRPARILGLLALGATDERIARALGIGTRTIRREISGLKTMLGVQSRAEIVAAAVRKGWL